MRQRFFSGLALENQRKEAGREINWCERFSRLVSAGAASHFISTGVHSFTSFLQQVIFSFCGAGVLITNKLVINTATNKGHLYSPIAPRFQ